MKWLIVLSVFAGVINTYAQGLSSPREQILGQIQISDVYLEPQYRFMEPRQGSMGLGDSFIEASWKLDKSLATRVQLGTTQGLYKPLFYGPDGSQNFGLRQAWGQWDSGYGVVRVGLLPLSYGLEGGIHPANLHLPDSRVYFNRWVAKHDYGISYDFQHDGFRVEMQGHNGETAANTDNQTWVTARWSYNVANRLRVGISGVTGRTTPLSTSGAQRGPDFIPAEQSRFRMGNAFAEYQASSRLHLAAEYHLGSMEQRGDRRPVQGGRMDVKYHISEQWAAVVRGEDFAGSTLNAAGRTFDSTAGLAYISANHTHNVFVYGTRIDREGGRYPEHQAFFVWKLTPLW
jgi:hypothetical protein